MMVKSPVLACVLTLFFSALGATWSGCAHRNGLPATVAPENSEELAAPLPPAVIPSVVTVDAGPNLIPPAVPETALPDRELLRTVEKVSVRINYGDLSVLGDQSHKNSGIKASLTQGSKDCKLTYAVVENELILSDQAPSGELKNNVHGAVYGGVIDTTKVGARPTTDSEKPIIPILIPNKKVCQFSIEIAAENSADLKIELKKGSISVEDWDGSSDIVLGSGDIGVNKIGQLKASCERCTLTGADVQGLVQFKMDMGNVGLTSLGGSVIGQTLGDVVLQWARLPKENAKVDVHTSAGDIVLSLPEAGPVVIMAKALRGEIYSQVKSSLFGMPINVFADLGNVRFLKFKKAEAN